MNQRVIIGILSGAAVLAAGVFIFWTPAPPAAVAAPAAVKVKTKPAVTAPAAPPVEFPPEPAVAVARRPAPRPERAPASAPTPDSNVSPDAGVLHLDADVPGAQVFIDRVFVGAAPLAALNVAPGSHRLNVTAPGYEGISEAIDVAPGPRDILIKFREVRLDARINVVHKHRIGSCKGTLVATPQGLRYETTEKSDAFSAALVDLESFEVDYLQKNLKVQPKKSKKYDFTDPENNADRLFVFHRDVDKARERMKKGDPPAPAPARP
jgi:hypothetical protein